LLRLQPKSVPSQLPLTEPFPMIGELMTPNGVAVVSTVKFEKLTAEHCSALIEPSKVRDMLMLSAIVPEPARSRLPLMVSQSVRPEVRARYFRRRYRRSASNLYRVERNRGRTALNRTGNRKNYVDSVHAGVVGDVPVDGSENGISR